MNLGKFADELSEQIQYRPLKTVPWLGIRLYERFLARRFSSLDLDRTHVYEREWDVLVVLDACRLDLIEGVDSDYPFLGRGGSVVSVGATSSTWMRRTFTSEYEEKIAETAYVNANPHSEFELDPNDFSLLDDIWRYAWDDELGTVPARPVTDRAVSTWREESPSRMIVHYMQPHAPFVNDREFASGIDIDRVGQEWTGNVWDRLRRGEVSERRVWEGYGDNLRYVLDDVSLLLNSIDADTVVITADHGNGLGEFGFFGHNPTVIPSVVRVPWYTTNARDSGEYTPTRQRQRGDAKVHSRLESLGYA